MTSSAQSDQQAIKEWLDGLRRLNRSILTVNAYQRDINTFMAFLAESKLALTDVELSHIQAYSGFRLDQHGLSITSLHRELSAIRSLFGWLIQVDQVQVNPAKRFKLKRVIRPLPEVADPDLLKQLLEQPAPDDVVQARLWVRDKAMLELFYSSGLRLTELVQLTLSDIDFERQLVTVTGKRSKTRIVPIGSYALRALNEWLDLRSQWVNGDQQILFVSETRGNALSVRTVERRVKWQAQRAELPTNLYPHLLRHCFATHLLAGSGDLRAVQEMLGHANINTTQIYTHLNYQHLSASYDAAHPRARKNKTQDSILDIDKS